jgi:hypothetical protein
MHESDTKSFSRRRFEVALDLLRAAAMTAAVGGAIVLAVIVAAALLSDR